MEDRISEDFKMIEKSVKWWEKETIKVIEEVDELEVLLEEGDWSTDVIEKIDSARDRLDQLIRRGDREVSEIERVVKREEEQQ
jgi:hypothetical protein